MDRNIVVFTGAGISAESGLSTFRDSGGLWEQYRIEDVATPQAWATNPELVLRFYNERFRQMKLAQPNSAHEAIVTLSRIFNVKVITQNVDDLHERAGSTDVLHLHGELAKCRSTMDETDIYPMPDSGLQVGDSCRRGYQLRPHIVWFGEMVPMMTVAEKIVAQADMLIVVGTSLNVYPAAGLIYSMKPGVRGYIVDPGEFSSGIPNHFSHLKGNAATMLPTLVNDLLTE